MSWYSYTNEILSLSRDRNVSRYLKTIRIERIPVWAPGKTYVPCLLNRILYLVGDLALDPLTSKEKKGISLAQ